LISIYYKVFNVEFDLDFFAPIFGVEDINSCTLGVMRFAEI